MKYGETWGTPAHALFAAMVDKDCNGMQSRSRGIIRIGKAAATRGRAAFSVRNPSSNPSVTATQHIQKQSRIG